MVLLTGIGIEIIAENANFFFLLFKYWTAVAFVYSFMDIEIIQNLSVDLILFPCSHAK